MPVGGILLFAGASVPEGALACDGSSVSRSDYPQLFETIGTTFGSGDGSTTFDLPELTAPAPGLRYIIRCANSPEQLEAANDW